MHRWSLTQNMETLAFFEPFSFNLDMFQNTSNHLTFCKTLLPMVYSASLHRVCHHVLPWTAPSPTLPALSFLSASHVPATCIVICYAHPTTLTELLLLCACSSQAFRLSCSLSTCLLAAIQLSFSVTVSMLAAPIQCGPPPLLPIGQSQAAAPSVH